MASIHICLIDLQFPFVVWNSDESLEKGSENEREVEWLDIRVDKLILIVIVDFCTFFRIFIQFCWLEGSQWEELMVIWRKFIAGEAFFCQMSLWKKIQRNKSYDWNLIFWKSNWLGHKIQMEIDNLTLFYTQNFSFIT